MCLVSSTNYSFDKIISHIKGFCHACYPNLWCHKHLVYTHIFDSVWLHYVNTFILNIFITIGACISKVNRVMKTLPGVSGTFTYNMSSPSSSNLSFTTKRKKKSPSSNKLRKSEHFQKKLIVSLHGEGRSGVYEKR